MVDAAIKGLGIAGVPYARAALADGRLVTVRAMVPADSGFMLWFPANRHIARQPALLIDLIKAKPRLNAARASGR